MANPAKEKTGTVPTSVRVTPTCERLWEALARSKGLSKAKVLEVIIRDRAKAEGIELPADQPQQAAA
jgi:hypothetical protein